MNNKGLGKGLSALMSQTKNINNDEVIKLNVNLLEKGKFQPRQIFDETAINELAESIKSHGVIQPVLVRKIPNSSKYEIIAGERRLKASILAGIQEIPVIVRDITDEKVSEQALIENIQRQNLSPVEEAEAYGNLLSIHNYTQEELSKSLGKTRSHIANMLRLNVLPKKVKDYINDGKLSFSHAKVIASHEDVLDIAEMIISKNLNVRQTEALIKKWSKNTELKQRPSSRQNIKSNEISEDLIGIERDLEEILGLKIKIIPEKNSNNSGKVAINYNNFEELDFIIELLNKKKNKLEEV